MKDGSVRRGEPTAARGDAHVPLSNEELEAKFRRLTAPLIGGGTDAVIEAVAGLDKPEGKQHLIDTIGTMIVRKGIGMNGGTS